jgi:hypothetical protein
MKITIEQEGKEPLVFDEVREYCLFGIRGDLTINDFDAYNGTPKHLLEKAYSGLQKMKKLFMEGVKE